MLPTMKEQLWDLSITEFWHFSSSKQALFSVPAVLKVKLHTTLALAL
jgi:hypothetical protein